MQGVRLHFWLLGTQRGNPVRGMPSSTLFSIYLWLMKIFLLNWDYALLCRFTIIFPSADLMQALRLFLTAQCVTASFSFESLLVVCILHLFQDHSVSNFARALSCFDVKKNIGIAWTQNVTILIRMLQFLPLCRFLNEGIAPLIYSPIVQVCFCTIFLSTHRTEPLSECHTSFYAPN